MDELEKQDEQELTKQTQPETASFDLDDILKEFGDAKKENAPTQAGVEAILREFADNPDSVVHIEDEPEEISVESASAEPETEVLESVAESSVTGDTIRMGAVTQQVAAAMGGDTIRMEPVTSDTMRLDTKNLPKGEVHIAQPIREEDEKEAFEEGWEPEYEQPMGSYNPPPPIIIHPRSRLRELKRKLVAGPERRYYELSGIGVGKLQAAIFFCLLVALASGAMMIMYTIGMIPETRLRLMVFSQFFGLLIAALLGSFQLIDGVSDLFKGRFTLNTLLVFNFLICCADGIFCLQQKRIPCCAAFSLQVTMSLWGAYHKRYTEMGQMDTLRKATHLDGLTAVHDYCDGKKGLLRFEGQVEHFMDHYASASAPEKIQGWYALTALVASVAIGVVAYVFYGISEAIHAAAVTCLAAAPAASFICLTRPCAVLERRLHKLGTVICGWQGVKGLSGKAVIPINHYDLFPAGTVKMNGVKFYGHRRPDDIVAYCTALVSADDGGLKGLFQQVSESRNAPRYDAKEVRAHHGGISGLIHGEPVLVGSPAFLQEMGVELPEGIRVHHAVCVAIENEMCGLFAVSYEKSKIAAAGLATVCGSRGVQPIVTVSDFSMTHSLLHSCFGKYTRKVIYPDQEVRAQLREVEIAEDAQSLLMTTKDGFTPIAYGISGARALKSASYAGLIVSMIGGILGILMMLALVVLGALELLTPLNMLAYQLVWLIPCWLISGWTRVL